MPSSKGSSQPRDRTCVSCIGQETLVSHSSIGHSFTKYLLNFCYVPDTVSVSKFTAVKRHTNFPSHENYSLMGYSAKITETVIYCVMSDKRKEMT